MRRGRHVGRIKTALFCGISSFNYYYAEWSVLRFIFFVSFHYCSYVAMMVRPREFSPRKQRPSPQMRESDRVLFTDADADVII